MAGPLATRILNYLRASGGDHISGVTKALSKDGGGPAHRLTLAGYLQAWEELGLAEAVEQPPAKIYRLIGAESRWPHAQVRDAVIRAGISPLQECAMVTRVLEVILERPIFGVELQLAGYGKPGRGVEPRELPQVQRRRYRAQIQAASSDLIRVPHGDPLYGATDSISHQDVTKVLAHVLRERMHWAEWCVQVDDESLDDATQTRLRVSS